MKKLIIGILVFSLVIAGVTIVAFAWQNEKKQEADMLYGPFIHSAYGVYLNLNEYMQADEDAQLAMLTARSYFNEFIQRTDILEYVNGDSSGADWYIDFKAALDVAYIRFRTVSNSIISGEQITDGDQAFLAKIYGAFDTMQHALRNQDGSLKWELLKDGYLAETIESFTASIIG